MKATRTVGKAKLRSEHAAEKKAKESRRCIRKCRWGIRRNVEPCEYHVQAYTPTCHLMSSECRCSTAHAAQKNSLDGPEDVDALAAADPPHSSRSWIDLYLLNSCLTARDSDSSASCKLSVSLNGGNMEKRQPSLSSNSQASPAGTQRDKHVCLTLYFLGHSDPLLKGNHGALIHACEAMPALKGLS